MSNPQCQHSYYRADGNGSPRELNIRTGGRQFQVPDNLRAQTVTASLSRVEIITAWVDSNGILAAKYNYGPYGNLPGMSGPRAEASSCRFSSKEYRGNAGLYYRGHRFYEPNLQWWLTQDRTSPDCH